MFEVIVYYYYLLLCVFEEDFEKSHLIVIYDRCVLFVVPLAFRPSLFFFSFTVKICSFVLPLRFFIFFILTISQVLLVLFSVLLTVLGRPLLDRYWASCWYNNHFSPPWWMIVFPIFHSRYWEKEWKNPAGEFLSIVHTLTWLIIYMRRRSLLLLHFFCRKVYRGERRSSERKGGEPLFLRSFCLEEFVLYISLAHLNKLPILSLSLYWKVNFT